MLLGPDGHLRAAPLQVWGAQGNQKQTSSWRTSHLQYLQDKMSWWVEKTLVVGKSHGAVELMEVNGGFSRLQVKGA